MTGEDYLPDGSRLTYSVISIREAPQAWADYKIRIKINGKYYTGELEMSE